MVERRDWTMNEVRSISKDRERRALELKRDGRKILGYFCSFFPIEILTAASILPFRFMGDLKEPRTEADPYCDPSNCPYLKSCFDMAIKGKYDFLDGWVTPDSCDNVSNIYRFWMYRLQPAYTYWMNVPNLLDEDCLQYFKRELSFLKENVEGFSQTKITDEKLHDAIELHNQQRSLLRRLQESRRPQPPLLNGSEMIMVLRAVMSLPVEEANELLRGVIPEVEGRRDAVVSSQCRLLVWGPEIDDPALYELIEDLGSNVVADDQCIGTRFFLHDVEKAADPLDSLSKHYLEDQYCPRIIRGKGEGWATRQQDLDDRFGHVARLAKDFSVDGAILYVMKYCDLHEFDVPDMSDYLTKQGYPALHVETDYSMAAVAGLRTRVEAFLEMIG